MVIGSYVTQQAEVEDAWYMDGEAQLIAIISDIPAGAGKVKDERWFGEGGGKRKTERTTRLRWFKLEDDRDVCTIKDILWGHRRTGREGRGAAAPQFSQKY